MNQYPQNPHQLPHSPQSLQPTSQPTSGAPGGPPHPSPSKKSKTGLIIAGVVGGSVLVGSAVAVVAMGVGSSHDADLFPFDVSHLPEETHSVSSTSLAHQVAGHLRLRAEDVPEEAYWSRLAERGCGGIDVFRQAMLAVGAKPRTLQRAARSLTHDGELYEKSLACGKTLYESMGKGGGDYVITFEKGDEEHTINLLQLGVEELPNSTDFFKDETAPGGMEEGRCMLPWKSSDDADCEDTSKTIARLEDKTVWAIASKDDLKQFGKKWSSDASNEEDDLVEMEKLGVEVESYQLRRLGIGDAFSGYLIDSIVEYPVSGYDFEERQEIEDLVHKDATAWALGQTDTHGVSKGLLVLVGEDEDAAKEMESALEAYVKELAGKAEDHAEDEEEKDEEDDDETPDEIQDYRELRMELALSALGSAKVERDGLHVRLTVEEAPNDSEQKGLHAFYAWNAEHAQAAARITKALAAGDEPDESDLESLHEELPGKIEKAGSCAPGDPICDPDADPKDDPGEIVPTFTSLRVPSGADMEKDTDGKHSSYDYTYGGEPVLTLERFEIMLRKIGWTRTRMEKLSGLHFLIRGKGEKAALSFYKNDLGQIVASILLLD